MGLIDLVDLVGIYCSKIDFDCDFFLDTQAKKMTKLSWYSIVDIDYIFLHANYFGY